MENTTKNGKFKKRMFHLIVSVEEIINQESGLSGVDLVVIKQLVDEDNVSKKLKQFYAVIEKELQEQLDSV